MTVLPDILVCHARLLSIPYFEQPEVKFERPEGPEGPRFGQCIVEREGSKAFVHHECDQHDVWVFWP